MKNIRRVFLGSLMLVTSIWAYYPEPYNMVEFSFVVNFLSSIFLLFDKFNENKPDLYLTLASGFFMLFIISLVSFTGIYKINLRGPYFFIHIINPPLFIRSYILDINEKKRSWKACFKAPFFTLIFFLFDYIRYAVTGKFIYGFFSPEDLNLLVIVIFALIIYATSFILALLLYYLNHRIKARRSHKKRG